MRRPAWAIPAVLGGIAIGRFSSAAVAKIRRHSRTGITKEEVHPRPARDPVRIRPPEDSPIDLRRPSGVPVPDHDPAVRVSATTSNNTYMASFLNVTRRERSEPATPTVRP